MTQTVLITHTDLDGYGSIVLSKLYNIHFKEIINWDYKDIDINALSQYRNIIMTDLSIPEDDFNTLVRKGIDITIYDHHESSRYLTKYPQQYWNNEQCGTMIFYEQYIKRQYNFAKDNNIDRFVRLVDTYDRWQKESSLWEEALNLNRYFYLFMKKSQQERTDKLISLIRNELCYTQGEHEMLCDVIKRENESYEKTKQNLRIYNDTHGIQYGVAPVFGQASLINLRLFKEFKDIQYTIYYYPNGRLSLRSRPVFDLTQLQGIKGHKNAAGGFVEQNVLDSIKSGTSIPYN